jgi:hypothetical protein
MDQPKQDMLTEHLPYELDMLERAYSFLHDPKFLDARTDSFMRNATIEVFWAHVRNLNEFFRYPAGRDHASAADFTKAQFPQEIATKELTDRLNEQIVC